MTNITAIIPARGGSKRLPLKNVKELYGRPLIAYSILLAKSMPSITSIVVVSDDQDTISIAKEWEVSTSYQVEAIGDNEPITKSLQNGLECGEWKGKADWVVLLQPTCPLRQPLLCEEWLHILLTTNNASGLLTVDFDSYKLGSVDYKGFYQPNYTPMTPKANVQPSFRENGVFYAFKAENVRNGHPWGSRILPVKCPRSQSLANIDTLEDWELTKYLYYEHGYDTLFKEMEEKLYD